MCFQFNIHVNSKFNRLRDRLRHRLNEKRCSQLRKDTCDTAKEGPIDVGLDNVPVPPENVCNNKTEKKVKGSRQRPPQSVFSLTAESGGAGVHATAVDTRDIQDLLEFIEGTDKVTRLAEQHKRELKRLKKERKVITNESTYRVETDVLINSRACNATAN